MSSRNLIKLSRRETIAAGGTAAFGSLAGCLGGIAGDDEFTIGMPLPLQGGLTPTSQSMIQAAEVIVERINDDGGLDGKTVETIVEDNEYSPQGAVEKTRRLINQEGADVIFGPVSSAMRQAIAPILEEEEVPGLYPVEYEGRGAEDYCNEWLFKIGDVPYQKIEPTIPWFMERYGDSFYLLGSDYVWPHSMNEVIREEVEANGGEILGEDYVALDATDFSSIVTRIVEADPDILFTQVTGEGNQELQLEMYNREVRDNWQQIGLANHAISLRGLPPGAVEGCLNAQPYFELIDSEENNEFVEAMYEANGDDTLIGPYSGLSAAAIRLLEEGIESAGGSDPDDIVSGIPGNEVTTPLGEVSVPYDNQVKVPMTIGEITSDIITEPIETFDAVMPPEECN